MKKLLLVCATLPLLALSFSSVSFAQEQKVDCTEYRDAATSDTESNRETIKANWDEFKEEFGGPGQFFQDLTDEERDEVKALRDANHEAVKNEKKWAKNKFKEKMDLNVIKDVHDLIVSMREEALDELIDYVDEGEEDEFEAWVDEFIDVLDTNKSLRDENAETRLEYRGQCYSERTQAWYTVVLERLEMMEEAMEGQEDELTEKLEGFVERIETMIETTENSNKTDEMIEDRVEVLNMVIDAINEILDGLTDEA